MSPKASPLNRGGEKSAGGLGILASRGVEAAEPSPPKFDDLPGGLEASNHGGLGPPGFNHGYRRDAHY